MKNILSKKTAIVVIFTILVNIIVPIFQPSYIYAGTGDSFNEVVIPYASLKYDYRDEEYRYLSYKDSWFSSGSADYNHDLARMSMGLVMSGYGRNDTASGPKDRNLKTLLKNLNFDMGTYKSTGFEDADREDTIATALCIKEIPLVGGGKTTLLAVVFRSINYGKGGWAGNFTVGDNGEKNAYHKGFYAAAAYARDKVDAYIKDNGLKSDSLKLWIVGYSRSAPIAGILSNLLLEEPLSLPPENVFTYTFSSANYQTSGSLGSSNSNTFHIIMPNDVETQVPFFSWGFNKSGHTKVLVSPASNERNPSNFDHMKDVFHNITTQANYEEKYTYYHYYSSEQAAACWMAHSVMDIIPDSDTYYGDHQQKIRDLLFGSITLPSAASSYIDMDGLKAALSNLSIYYEKEDMKGVSDCIGKIHAETLNARKLLNNFKVLDDSYTEALDLVLDILEGAEREIKNGSDEMPNFHVILAASCTILDKTCPYMLNKHYPETMLAWLLATEEEDIVSGEDFGMKTLFIKGDADIRISDSGGNILADIKDKKVHVDKNGIIKAALMGSNSAVFCFPAGHDFFLDIKSRSDQGFSYNIFEMRNDQFINRTLTIDNVSTYDGQEFTASVNGIEKCGREAYSLYSDNMVYKIEYDSDYVPESKDTPGDSAEKARRRYGDDPLSEKTVMVKGKLDITSLFPSVSEKKRYTSSDKRVLTINKKGITKGRKKGSVTVSLERKSLSAYETVSSCVLTVEAPFMVKNASASIAEKDASLSAFYFLTGTDFAPTEWKSSNEKVAKVDAEGNITLLKKGKTKIIAVFGKGKLSTGKKYKTVLTVR